MPDDFHILIAEDNEISLSLMRSILETHGYQTIAAADGEEAINTIKSRKVDMAFVDLNMQPKGGFEFVKYLVSNSIELPVVIVTADESSDVLMRATDLGVSRVLQKPVDPKRLLNIADTIKKRYGSGHKSFVTETHDIKHTPEDLMHHAIEIAQRNVHKKRGGPYGALVANQDGKIIGEGTNAPSSRFDPVAHAEIMAIRQAAEKLGKADLSECSLYCSSEPTMMGKALIISVGIKTVYYGLSHTEINEIRGQSTDQSADNAQERPVEYIRLKREEALTLFQNWQQEKT